MTTLTPAEVSRAETTVPHERCIVRRRDLDTERLLAALLEQERADAALRAECRAAWLITAGTAIVLALIMGATLLHS